MYSSWLLYLRLDSAVELLAWSHRKGKLMSKREKQINPLWGVVCVASFSACGFHVQSSIWQPLSATVLCCVSPLTEASEVKVLKGTEATRDGEASVI